MSSPTSTPTNTNTTTSNTTSSTNSVSSSSTSSTVYLKLFQDEIDNLSTRCQQSENKLTDLIQLLTNVPDPFPAIELVKKLNENDLYKQIEKLQLENKNLKETLNAYSNELNLFNNREVNKYIR